MRTIRHWTPRYAFNRIRVFIYELTHRSEPWLTADANRIIASYLRPDHVGVEFGSGRSTLWLAGRLRHLTSVEDYREWYVKVSEMLTSQGRDNVRYLFCDSKEQYLGVFDEIDDQSLDFALVDSAHYRDLCLVRLVPKMKPGGLIVLDNAQWYLPCDSSSPAKLSKATAECERFSEMVKSWRRVWTTNGVNDTALFFKPDHQ